MATIEYDEIRIALKQRPNGDYLIEAVDADRRRHSGTFRVPFGRDAFERHVIGFSRTHAPGRSTVAGFSAAATDGRDVGMVDPTVVDAEEFGGALADALFVGALGDAYDSARRRARQHDRGLRITLSLADAPDLLAIPWELLWRPSGFIACQERTPLVRHLDAGEPALPPPVDRAVRVLGIVASPNDLPPLDVEAEKDGIELATSGLVGLGRVDLEWLDRATPSALHRALRQGGFHVLHFVGHGGSSPAGVGVLYLENDTGTAAPIDSSTLRTLLGDEAQLRVIVLNSCHGARTTLADPMGGVSFALIECGIPAVVAMQFAISDAAAITFAEELYNNLVGWQRPIDAAVADARMRVYLVSPLEFATPVLYVRDPNVELFRFLMPAVVAPIVAEVADMIAEEPAPAELAAEHTSAPAAAKTSVSLRRRLLRFLVGAAAATAAVVTTVVLWPDSEPHPLAGSWDIDEWRLVEVEPVPENLFPLPGARWTITPDPADCTDDDCSLHVFARWDDGTELEFTLRPTDSGWQGAYDSSTYCVEGDRTTDPASIGVATYLVESNGEDGTLEIHRMFDGTPTAEGTARCLSSPPIVAIDHVGTARRMND